MRAGLGGRIVQAGVVSVGTGCLYTVDFNFLFGTSKVLFLIFGVDFSSNLDFALLNFDKNACFLLFFLSPILGVGGHTGL